MRILVLFGIWLVPAFDVIGVILLSRSARQMLRINLAPRRQEREVKICCPWRPLRLCASHSDLFAVLLRWVPRGEKFFSTLRRRERCGGEVDAETCAPNANRLVLAQVRVRREVVVLVALVAFQRAEIDEARLFHGVVAFLYFGGD